MSMIECEINGIPVTVPAGTTILDAAKELGVTIPKLCYHTDLDAWAACGICVVKVEGSPKMLRACATTVGPGMKGKCSGVLRSPVSYRSQSNRRRGAGKAPADQPRVARRLR